MKSNKVPLLFLILVFLAGCGSGGSGGGPGGSAVTLVSIAVTPEQPFADPGATAQFTATGVYSDSTTTVLTESVTWSSSNPSVATISNAAGSRGTATSVAVGITAITAVLGGVSGSTSLTVAVGGNGGPGTNVLALTVNGSLCSPSTSVNYVNKPCVSVTVCTPGSGTACQTISDILLDTGSSGLRLFKQALTNPSVVLSPVTSGTGLLAECAHFADGSTDWGPVQRADVRLGNEPAVTVSIQVIDAAFGTVAPSCGTPDTSPAAAGFNGILGVGIFAQDCGAHCVSLANGNYFSCRGSVCPGAAAPLPDQVTNPVTLLPRNNNGVIVQLPRVPLGGAPSVSGNLILGIGTSANNTPAGVPVYATNTVGEIVTTMNGTSYPNSIIDTGSNGLFFPPPSATQLPGCAPPNDSWFCPQSTVALSAVNAAATGSPSVTVSFQVGHFNNLLNSNNHVFSEVGGAVPPSAGLFDWGLPFFYGRDVYVGFDGKPSTLGSGPYFAY